MYLIPRPKLQADELINLLAKNEIRAKYLPLIKTQLNQSELATLESRIYNCQGVLFTSPSSICYIADRLVRFKTKELFAVGASSASYLETFIPNKKINYPVSGSGINALIQDKVLALASLDSLAIIGSGEINLKLAAYLQLIHLNYEFIDLYQRINIGLENLQIIKLALSDSAVTGIVVTSVGIAKYLIECITKLNLTKRLQEINLITIHPQISSFLQSQGYFKIQQTQKADNAAILTLLGE